MARYAKADKGKAKGTLLMREGDMFRSLSHQEEGDAVLIGFAVPYAAYHEFGTVRMPRRGLLTGIAPRQRGARIELGQFQAAFDAFDQAVDVGLLPIDVSS